MGEYQYLIKANQAILEIETLLHEMPDETREKLIEDLKHNFIEKSKNGQTIVDYSKSFALYDELLKKFCSDISVISDKEGFPIAVEVFNILIEDGLELYGNTPNFGNMLYYIITNESPFKTKRI